MGLIFCVEKMCGRCHNTRKRSAVDERSSDERAESPRHVYWDRAQPAPGLTISKTHAAQESPRAAADSEVHEEYSVDADKQYLGVENLPNVTVTTARLARDLAQEKRFLCGCCVREV